MRTTLAEVEIVNWDGEEEGDEESCMSEGLDSDYCDEVSGDNGTLQFLANRFLLHTLLRPLVISSRL